MCKMNRLSYSSFRSLTQELMQLPTSFGPNYRLVSSKMTIRKLHLCTGIWTVIGRSILVNLIGSKFFTFMASLFVSKIWSPFGNFQ